MTQEQKANHLRDGKGSDIAINPPRTSSWPCALFFQKEPKPGRLALHRDTTHSSPMFGAIRLPPTVQCHSPKPKELILAGHRTQPRHCGKFPLLGYFPCG